MMTSIVAGIKIDIPALLNQLDAPTASAVARANTKHEAKWSFILASYRTYVEPLGYGLLLTPMLAPFDSSFRIQYR